MVGCQNNESRKLLEPVILLKSLNELVDCNFPLINPELHLDERLNELPYLGCFFKNDLLWLDERGLIEYTKFSSKIRRFRKCYHKALTHALIAPEYRAKNIIKRAISYCKRKWPCGKVRVKQSESYYGLGASDSFDDLKYMGVAFTQKGIAFYHLLKEFEQIGEDTVYNRVTQQIINKDLTNQIREKLRQYS